MSTLDQRIANIQSELDYKDSFKPKAIASANLYDRYASLSDKLDKGQWSLDRGYKADAVYYLTLAVEEATQLYGTADPNTESIKTRLTQTQALDESHNYLNMLSSKVIRWSDDTTQLMVYISPPTDIDNWQPAYLNACQDAFKRWEEALNHKITFSFTTDKKDADVLVGWFTKPQMAQYGERVGYNTFELKGKYFLKNDIYILVENRNLPPLPLFYNIMLHETGHMLGIKQHSQNPMDIMSIQIDKNSDRLDLSQRDIATMQALYQRAPDYTNPKGYKLAGNYNAVKRNLENLILASDFILSSGATQSLRVEAFRMFSRSLVNQRKACNSIIDRKSIMKRIAIAFLLLLLGLNVSWAEVRRSTQVIYQEVNASDLNEADLKQHLSMSDPQRPQSLVFLGMLALREQHNKTAEQYFQQAMKEMPTGALYALYNFECLGGLGIAATNQLRFTDGKNYFTRAFQLAGQLPPVTKPMVAELYGHYGESLLDTGYLNDSKAMIQKGLSLDPACQICQEIQKLFSLDLDAPDYFKEQGKEIIRWADDKRIINIYLSSGDGERDWNPNNLQLAKKAFAEWEKASGNRFHFQWVDNPENSDVVIRWSAKSAVENGENTVGFANEDLDEQYVIDKNITICLHLDNGEPVSQNEIYCTLLHEIGHMLGISEHSLNPADIMSPESGRQVITGRDIATLNRIYETEPDYTNPPGMTLAQYRAQRN